MRIYGFLPSFLKGFSFGMLLQLAVGPVCIFVFNTANSRSFGDGMAAVAAVTLVDALYILAAALGPASFLKSDGLRRSIRRVGGLVVLLFGIDGVLGAMGTGLLPAVRLPVHLGTEDAFLRGFILTASNPLTIVFWAGVFTAKIQEETSSRSLVLFSVGAVSAGFVFLSGVALVGLLVKTFLPPPFVRGLNGAVGFVLIVFGLKMLLGTKRPSESSGKG